MLIVFLPFCIGCLRVCSSMKIKDGFVGDSNVTADQPKWKHKNSWHDLMMMVFLSLERIHWSLSFTKFWVFLPWQRRCHQSREVWWLWVGPEVFWNLEEQPSWNQQIEIFKNGQLENCHGCPFYHAEEGSAINKIISILNCAASWFLCQKVLKISVQAILQTGCPLHLPLFPSTSVQAIFRSIHSTFNTFHRAIA